MNNLEDETLRATGFYWRAGESSVRALVCRWLEQDGFTNAFSTRIGGTSPMPHNALNLAGFDRDTPENIAENSRRFLALFSGNWRLATTRQVHGNDVHTVRNVSSDAADEHAKEKRADALVTAQRGVLLGVNTADCVPVLLGCARTGAAAAIHAGWRGIVNRIVRITLERMRQEFGSEPSDIRAAIGPAARLCCYEVGPEVIEAFRERFQQPEHLFESTRNGHARIDLHKANEDQLTEAGVPPEQIHTAPLCTMCRTDLFFSHRRESNRAYPVGRLLAIIGKG